MNNSINFNEPLGRVKMMSIYRAAHVPPDWSQENPDHPGYIQNKPVFVAGKNINITKDGNSIIISADGIVIPDGPDDPDTPDTPDNPDLPDEPSEEGSVVKEIIINKIPIFVGVENEGEQEKNYQLLDGNTASYKSEGFYVVTENDNIAQAGYQVTFDGARDGNESGQTILFLNDATIIKAYQYIPSMERWILQELDQYWVKDDVVTKKVNDTEYTYVRYIYNVEMWESPIITTEYWRFEIGVEE